LILPALGPLPWLLTGLGGDAHIVAHQHQDGSVHHAHHDHHDRSDVPGSPTHSPDHNCLACQVLGQLGRCCAWSTPPLLQPSPAPALLATLSTEKPLPLASSFTLIPPARAPPAHPA